VEARETETGKFCTSNNAFVDNSYRHYQLPVLLWYGIGHRLRTARAVHGVMRAVHGMIRAISRGIGPTYLRRVTHRVMRAVQGVIINVWLFWCTT
jgi:hypothetical protein